MQPTRFFYICNNTHSTLGTEEVLKGVCVGGEGGFHYAPRLPNARELLRGSMASSIYCKKKNCHFGQTGCVNPRKRPGQNIIITDLVPSWPSCGIRKERNSACFACVSYDLQQPGVFRLGMLLSLFCLSVFLFSFKNGILMISKINLIIWWCATSAPAWPNVLTQLLVYGVNSQYRPFSIVAVSDCFEK
jgi:hypothetical protein